MIRNVNLSDTKAVCDIYNYYVENTIVTFDYEQMPIETMEKKIKSIISEYPWLVFEESGKVLGYAYASKWRSKFAYRYSIESTVYLDPKATGKGIGSKLYSELFKLLKEQNIRNVFGVIALPNEGSIALHEKFGFEKTGHFKEVGYKFDKWIDVGYWQLRL